jgi:hypothetical protein
MAFFNSVAGLDDFWPDPDSTFKNVRLRFQIRILALKNFRLSFFLNFFDEIMPKKSLFMDQKVKRQGFLKFLHKMEIW